MWVNEAWDWQLVWLKYECECELSEWVTICVWIFVREWISASRRMTMIETLPCYVWMCFKEFIRPMNIQNIHLNTSSTIHSFIHLEKSAQGTRHYAIFSLATQGILWLHTPTPTPTHAHTWSRTLCQLCIAYFEALSLWTICKVRPPSYRACVQSATSLWSEE